MAVARIGIAGAGTMGAGVAQIAALGGFEVRLHDPVADALDRGAEQLRANLRRGADRGRWTEAEADAAARRVHAAPTLAELGACEVVIEAAPERLELKRDLFAELERVCAANAVLATNTSSLPVGEVAATTARPERVCGMHFFNPPALMKLVEVVAAERTTEETVAVATDTAERMGRTPIRCADSPGFIVNRCNRPFTLEALAILDEGVAGAAAIDTAVRDAGYRMGPFEYMDLIGIDVNLEVARSFFAQRPEPRWRPHPIQAQLVAAGRLGRKSGGGFYDYGPDGQRLAGADERGIDAALARQVVERIVAQLVNEASFAVEEGVAGPGEIDTAMRLGLNHPRGPFEWGRELGPERVLSTLESLRGELGGDRYAAAGLLRRWVSSGGTSPPQ
jgi:3-hydroxybutyryl-CoA dehydrogenase